MSLRGIRAFEHEEVTGGMIEATYPVFFLLTDVCVLPASRSEAHNH